MDSSLEGEVIIVLGAPRSGTSMVANAFRSFGFFFGKEEDFPPLVEANPLGTFELQVISQLNLRISEALYLRLDPSGLRPLEEHPRFSKLVSEAGQVLRTYFEGHKRWGWKEPATSQALPIYLEALKREGVSPSFVICVRRPGELFLSQSRIIGAAEENREEFSRLRSYRQWLSYTLKSLAFTRACPRAIIAHHLLIQGPTTVLESAYRELGGIPPSLAELEAASKTVRPELHRNREAEDVPRDAPEIVNEVWTLCMEASHQPNKLSRGGLDGRIQDLFEKFDASCQCFGEPPPPFAQFVFFLPGTGKRVASSPIGPGRWNSVKIEIDVPPGSVLLGMLYPLAANVYLRRPLCGNLPFSLKATGETVETREGDIARFTVVPSGPQVTLTTPRSAGPYKVEMEAFIETNSIVWLEQISRLAAENGRLRQQGRR